MDQAGNRNSQQTNTGTENQIPHALTHNNRKKDLAERSGSHPGAVISALWEAEVGGSPEVRSLRQAWPTWRNPISTKNTNSWAHGGRCL
ncbi:putative uncharacterized protein C8orf44 [Plecturocebus cupreus]